MRKLNFAVIAHDEKKASMVSFIMKRLDFFKEANIFATGTTGRHIEQAGLSVNKLKSGPLGGDAQIASLNQMPVSCPRGDGNTSNATTGGGLQEESSSSSNLSQERDKSSIPMGGKYDGHVWIYPSEQASEF